MNRIAVLSTLCMLAVVGTGCANGRIRGLCPERDGVLADPIVNNTDYATASDLDAAAQRLLARMRVHKAFKSSYDEIKTKAGGLPVLVVDDVACPACLPFSSKAGLELLKEKLVTSAFESGLFCVYDGSAADSEKADLVLQGRMTAVHEAAGCNVYRLQLQLKARSSGLIVWTGTETFVKLH